MDDMVKKKKPSVVSQPALGDLLLVHMPYDDWFLRKAYISEGGERRARLIDHAPSREKLHTRGLRQAKSEKARLLQLIKSEMKEDQEVNRWQVIADFVAKG